MVDTLTMTRKSLGEELRQWRIRAGLSSREVEQHLEWHDGKSARVERGFRVPSPVEVNALLQLYRVPEADREHVRSLGRAARKKVAPNRLAAFANTYLAMEREAAFIRYWDMALVPSLLQTEGYARALLAQSGVNGYESRVPPRLTRQQLLTEGEPPEVRVLLGEAALYQEVGGRQVLKGQLRHLVEMGELPNVNIRFIPYTAGASRGLGACFTHLSMRTHGGTPTGLVYQEGLTDATYIQTTPEVLEYSVAFDLMWDTLAADGAGSATMLNRRIEHIGGPDE